MPLWNPFRRRNTDEVTEAATAVAAPVDVTRSGYEYGIPPGGLHEWSQTMGSATQSDRRSLLQQLYESYLACPWSWACVNAIARTITAGGLVFDWDNDSGEGDQEQPDKPPEVLACERLFQYTNPREDIRQLMRSVITDLLVFGDAFVEVVWLGNVPVALYSLDAPSMTILADEHGDITKYVQITEFGQRAEFEPRDVIHISLDSPRSGLFGVSPTQAALLPITAWLFAAATLKETFRKGHPVTLHVDMPQGMAPAEVNRWAAMYMQRNLGPRNIGTPVMTKGGAQVRELAVARVEEFLHTLDQKRDEVLSTYGVPPALAGVIESGNLGGGTGETQRKNFITNTCNPIAALVLEKIDFHLVRGGFRINGWHVKFAEVDMRDSKVIEDIRDQRLRNGSWSLNKYRTEIGEPPVDGGDQAVLVQRQAVIRWRDMDAFSKAEIAFQLKGTTLDLADPGDEDTPVGLVKLPAPLAPTRGVVGPVPGGPADSPAVVVDGVLPPGGGAAGDPAGGESYGGRPLRESWHTYRVRLAQALRELPDDNT